ncbi:MAG TPA: 30S ribosome-binding factor RbfA [Chloroflexi bacterium]|nr:30S ribosome-binding factor RbfA [Chloroflexota bacterium]
MGKKYLRRVNQLLQRKIAELLLEESNDPRFSAVTITDVSVNRDTTRAEVYFSIIGTPEEIAETQAALNHAAGWLRSKLAPTLRLRNIPQLIFIYDPSLAHGERIDALLHQFQHEAQSYGPDTTATPDTDDLPASEE